MSTNQANEFQLVSRKKHSRKNFLIKEKQHQKLLVSQQNKTLKSDNDSELESNNLTKLLTRLHDVINEINKSELLEQLLLLLSKNPCSLLRCDIVCYGLGNFSSCYIARNQFSLLVLLKENLSANSCNCYDPKFTNIEKDSIERFKMTLITSNEEGKREVGLGRPTLFYMPHCGRPLFNNLLFANWSVDQLCNICIIGNSFRTMFESVSTNSLKEELFYIYSILPCTVEIPLISESDLDNVFNDLSFHWFSKEKLKEISPDMWLDLREPSYQSDVEIIQSENIN